jgi:hypothetical protein
MCDYGEIVPTRHLRELDPCVLRDAVKLQRSIAIFPDWAEALASACASTIGRDPGAIVRGYLESEITCVRGTAYYLTGIITQPPDRPYDPQVNAPVILAATKHMDTTRSIAMWLSIPDGEADSKSLQRLTLDGGGPHFLAEGIEPCDTESHLRDVEIAWNRAGVVVAGISGYYATYMFKAHSPWVGAPADYVVIAGGYPEKHMRIRFDPDPAEYLRFQALFERLHPTFTDVGPDRY